MTFRELFDAEFNYVCRVLRRLGVREADMEDMAQELFVSVHRRFDELDPNRGPRPWLFSFALRASANYRRLARHRERDELSPEAPSSSPNPEQLAVRDQARQQVLAALDALPFERRTVFVMHDIEGFSAPEIAKQVEVPLNTVYSRLRLARADFRKAIADQRGREEET